MKPLEFFWSISLVWKGRSGPCPEQGQVLDISEEILRSSLKDTRTVKVSTNVIFYPMSESKK